jgi:pyridoxal phosphate enzyme (YggS family)
VDATVIDPAVVAANASAVRERIAAAGGDPDRVALVAVTKAFPAEVVDAAAAAGLLDLGENYAQELRQKAAHAIERRHPVRWHFVGRIQRNKVRHVAEHVALWHGVDRLEVAEAIASRAPGARVLVQVNVTDEPQKGGCPPAVVEALVRSLRLIEVEVAGLMAVGPGGDPEAARPGFRLLRSMAADLGLAELSMGMTGDLEVAVQEGATIVRVGTALFGPRPSRMPRSDPGPN